MLCLSDAGMPGTFLSGQAVFVNPRISICARSLLFREIVDFAAFLMFAVIRQEFAFCTCKEQVKLICLVFISERKFSGISSTKFLWSSPTAAQTTDLICTRALLGKSVKWRERIHIFSNLLRIKPSPRIALPLLWAPLLSSVGALPGISCAASQRSYLCSSGTHIDLSPCILSSLHIWDL